MAFNLTLDEGTLVAFLVTERAHGDEPRHVKPAESSAKDVLQACVQVGQHVSGVQFFDTGMDLLDQFLGRNHDGLSAHVVNGQQSDQVSVESCLSQLDEELQEFGGLGGVNHFNGVAIVDDL